MHPAATVSPEPLSRRDAPAPGTAPPAWRELRALLERFVARRVAPRDVEDVLHDVFVRISRGLPSLRDGERLTAWVHQVARHAIVDHHRRPRSRRDEPDAADADGVAADPADEPDASAELVAVLREFVHLLPATDRAALELTDLDGVTQTEAARRLGLSVPGMKSRVQRARARLRALLDACCDIELDARGRVVDCALRERPAALPHCCANADA